jgi:hypothetical protein
MQAVHVKAPARLLGRLVEARIDKTHPNSLSGRLEPTTRRDDMAARTTLNPIAQETHKTPSLREGLA